MKTKSGGIDEAKPDVKDRSGGVDEVKPDKQARIWEIDFLRGVAIALMIFFHLLVDLRDFFGYDIAYNQLPWMVVGKTSAILFMLISGVSCSLSAGNIIRGIKVFLCGMVVTVGTYFFVPELYIRFGILHFLGSAMIIWGVADKLIKSDKVKIALLSVCSPAIIAIGILFDGMRTSNPFLFFLGLRTGNFVTYDYYPLAPWLGVFLAGAVIGILIYKSKKRTVISFEPADTAKPVRLALGGFMAMGRKSLLIYIVHQPVLLGILYLIHYLYKTR
jgi:uncharacterized membrane protein